MINHEVPTGSPICGIKAVMNDDNFSLQLRLFNSLLKLYTMFNQLFIAFMAAFSVVSAIPALPGKVVESVTNFNSHIIYVVDSVLIDRVLWKFRGRGRRIPQPHLPCWLQSGTTSIRNV